MKSDYISVKSFRTVDDVLRYDSQIQLEEKEHYSINKDSVVKAVYYDGKKLKNNQFIKRGSYLNFTIDYKYIEDPKSKLVIDYVDENGKKLRKSEEFEGYVGDGTIFHIIFTEINCFYNFWNSIDFLHDKIPPICFTLYIYNTLY